MTAGRSTPEPARPENVCGARFLSGHSARIGGMIGYLIVESTTEVVVLRYAGGLRVCRAEGGFVCRLGLY